MKNWISIVLLFSFLRLQVVCCCGSVVHCDTGCGLANPATRVVCRHIDESCKPISAKSVSLSEIARTSNKPKCSCAKNHAKRAPIASTIETVVKRGSICRLNPICECEHRSCDENGHHHLYWLSHGNVVPQSKIGLNHSVVRQSFDRSFVFTPHHDDFQNGLENLLPWFSPPDRLSLFGHWLI